MPRHKTFAGQNERVRRKDRYLRKPNANLNGVNGLEHLANDERVLQKTSSSQKF